MQRTTFISRLLVVAVFRWVLAQPPFEKLASSLKAAALRRDVKSLRSIEEEMLRYYPDFAPTLPVLAKQWMNLRFEHSAHAVNLLERFQKLHPEIVDVPLLVNNAYLLFELGRHEKAMESLVQAVKHVSSEEKDFAKARLALAQRFIFKSTPDSLLEAAKLLFPVVQSTGNEKDGSKYTLLAKTPEIAVSVLRLHDLSATVPSNHSNANEEFTQLVSTMVATVLSWINSRDSFDRRTVEPDSGAQRPWRLSAMVESIEIDPRESSWESSLQLALKKNANARAPLRVSYPMDASVDDVWEAFHWKVRSWDTARLRDVAGKQYIYASCRHQRGPSEFGFWLQRRVMRFNKFLDNLATGKPCYLNVQGLDGEVYQPPLNKGLSMDVPIPSTLPLGRHQLDRVTLWMGNASGMQSDECWNEDRRDGSEDCACSEGEGSLSRFHHDNQDNVIVILKGVKQYALFPPRHAHNLYTVGEISHIEASGAIRYVNDFGGDGAGEHFSLASNVFQPSEVDLKRFPSLEQALPEGGTVTLGPGQLLFIPAGWFHQVRSCSSHMALNFWWDV